MAQRAGRHVRRGARRAVAGRRRHRHPADDRVAARRSAPGSAAACGARRTGCPSPTWSGSATARRVNRGCVVQTHLFHDRIMRMDTVTLARARRSARTASCCPARRSARTPRSGPARWSCAVRPCRRTAGGSATRSRPGRRGRPAGMNRAGGARPRRAPSARPTPYLPEHGNGGYRVAALRPRRWTTGSLPTGSPAGPAITRGRRRRRCRRFSLDLGRFRVDRVRVDGRPASYTHRPASCGSGRRGRSAPGATFTVDVRYAGTPQPIRGRWGDIGWEELTDGALVASQPIGAPSWFPCNDRPGDKATLPDRGDHAVAVHGRRQRRPRLPPARRGHHDLGVRAATTDADLPR